MPESFDSMLSELADAAVSATALPDITAIRKRARQRAVRHRMAASALAVALIGVSGVAVAAVAAHRPTSAGVAAAASPGTTATVRSAIPSPDLLGASSPTASAVSSSASPTTSSSASAFRAPTVGLWKRSDATTGYLVIYGPDGTNGRNAVIGITEAGSWDLCYGIIAPLDAKGIYPITGVQCGGNLAPDMQLGFDKGTGFILFVPATKTSAAYTIPYQNDDTDLGDVGVNPNIQAAVGTWVDSAGRKFTVSAKGTAVWSGLSHGSVQGGTGTVQSALGGLSVLVPCSSGNGDCGVFQLVFNPSLTQMTVIGSYGPDQFQHATSATGSTASTGTTSATP